MKRDDFLSLVHNRHNQRVKLLIKKNHDYATISEDGDFLANFMRVSGIMSALSPNPVQPSDVALFHILTKLDRIQNLKNSGKKPENESVQDTLLDLRNYIDIYDACIQEEKT